MSRNLLVEVFDADLNSERNRAVLGFLFGKMGAAIVRFFPTRAAACYSALIAGLTLGFVPVAKDVPVKFTLATTFIGAGLVAVAAHELDELQDDIDDERERRQRDRNLRLFADTEVKTKQAETHLLRNAHTLEKGLPAELQQAINPASPAAPATTKSKAEKTGKDTIRAQFNAAVEAVKTKDQREDTGTDNPDFPTSPLAVPRKMSRSAESFTDTMREIAQRMVSMTVIGIPGAGKDMLVSNLLRLVRHYHPEIYIFVMEGKGDPKEAGYWQDAADDYRSIQALQESRETVVSWVNGCLQDFRAIEGAKLLVFGEVTYLYKVWQEAEPESFKDYVSYKIGLSSMGDSTQQYIWEIGQVSNAKDLGVTGGVRSLFKPVAIISNHDRSAATALLLTKFVPLPEGGKAEVMQMCDHSPCGRAIYDYVSDCWQPLQELKNFSGFNRDTRETIALRRPTAIRAKDPLPKLTGIRAQLEELLEAEPPKEPTSYGLTAAQIQEVQKRLTSLQVGTLSTLKNLRERSRTLKTDGITQANLVPLFDFLAKTNAIEWTTSDKRQFRYLGGLAKEP